MDSSSNSELQFRVTTDILATKSFDKNALANVTKNVKNKAK